MSRGVSTKASQTTWTVGDDGTADFNTIQEAINKATLGDTIFVYNGTYYENVVVNKSVSLVGENRETTIIDGSETGSVIFVTALVRNVKIEGFTIRKSGNGVYDSGIFVDHSSGNHISHNIITENLHGIYLSYSRDTMVSANNVFSNKVNGIGLDSSSSNVVSDNNVTSNGVNGIRLSFSNNNIISGNNASSNSANGIRLDSSSGNTVSSNTASNNDQGIQLDFSTGNVVSGNTASNNEYGIRLDSLSKDNTIYHNNFNNTNQAQSDSVNVWDYSGEGNYWSNYTGQDLIGDGIGDTPYLIDENNQDNHPLMGKFSDFKVAWEDKTYHPTTICNSTIFNFSFEIGRETGNKMISFDVTGEDGTVGFCRVAIPTELMNYSLIILVDGREISPTLLDASSKTHIYLYFTYVHSSHTITIISSQLLYLYNELLDKYEKSQIDFHSLNSTYYELLDNYRTLLGNYSQLLESYNSLDIAYQELTGNYSQLQERYVILNTSYREHSSLLLEHAQTLRNLTYVFIATTAIFIIAAVYLSTQAHRRVSGS